MRMFKVLTLLLCGSLAAVAQDTLTCRLELSANVSSGDYAPLWFTANRHGLSSQRPSSGYLRAGAKYNRAFCRDWSLEAGLDFAGTVEQTAPFTVQQAYVDVSWKRLIMSFGSKEMRSRALCKNPQLTSGMMVEGLNARPIPQARIESKGYIGVPFTKGWLGVKGHLAYGLLTDGKWREGFFADGQRFSESAVYHTKSLTLRLGRAERFPFTVELGLLDAAQFGGSLWKKNSDGDVVKLGDRPEGLKSFLKALVPVQESTLENVEGNHVGSWSFALAYHAQTWKARLYYEHYFDDHSQMTWQYGPWRDGHIGVELELPRNPYVTAVLWEGLSTYNQTSPILYNGVAGSFSDVQMSGNDNYYNHGDYNWQHWGNNIGHPFCAGPVYNGDRRNVFRSTRVKANHVGISGNPARSLSYRVLVSYVRHWGTYDEPLDKRRRQFSSLCEISYASSRFSGLDIAVSCGFDRGNYLGNSVGGMLTIRKTVVCFKK